MTVSLNLSEVAAFKTELLNLLQQLRAEIDEDRQHQAECSATTQDVHDRGEEANTVADLLVSVESLSRHSEEVAECLEALGRIETGDFGFCVDCSEEIELSRLKACPTASRCIRCQSAFESQRAIA